MDLRERASDRSKAGCRRTTGENISSGKRSLLRTAASFRPRPISNGRTATLNPNRSTRLFCRPRILRYSRRLGTMEEPQDRREGKDILYVHKRTQLTR